VKRSPAAIIAEISKIDSDIVVLTETNSVIDLGSRYYKAPSRELPISEGSGWRDGENRTTIWSKYPQIDRPTTFNSSISVCSTIDILNRELNVYGTVIGVLGNRRKSFIEDLHSQIQDWKGLKGKGNICIAGDFNISFKDNYYYTEEGRQLIEGCFSELRIKNLTRDIDENIDHIAVSEAFLEASTCTNGFWNEDKTLSDHIGVWVSIEKHEGHQ
jgi:endonuclease/exonuclease/phosphatase family metal-dependent hydrolase